jgi:hypothetical protein
MDLRWGGDDINRIRALAQELVGLQPDIILTNGTPATVALQRETQTIPIVHCAHGRPRGKRHRSATQRWEAGGSHGDIEIETAIIALGREPGGGLVVMPGPFGPVHRVPIISAAARSKVPAVVPHGGKRSWVEASKTSGGSSLGCAGWGCSSGSRPRPLARTTRGATPETAPAMRTHWWAPLPRRGAFGRGPGLRLRPGRRSSSVRPVATRPDRANRLRQET